MLTLAGRQGDHPPTDPDGFLDFARSLRFLDIYQTVRDAEPLDDPIGFRFPASIRHRYERLDRFPDGLLVLGDAVCSFNPVYGQGMSVAAVEALALRHHVEGGASAQPRRFLHGGAAVALLQDQVDEGLAQQLLCASAAPPRSAARRPPSHTIDHATPQVSLVRRSPSQRSDPSQGTLTKSCGSVSPDPMARSRVPRRVRARSRLVFGVA
jgi:hypothetical protein